MTAAPPRIVASLEDEDVQAAPARYAAHARPLCPPPTTTTSRSVAPMTGGYRRGTSPDGTPTGCFWGIRFVKYRAITPTIARSASAERIHRGGPARSPRRPPGWSRIDPRILERCLELGVRDEGAPAASSTFAWDDDPLGHGVVGDPRQERGRERGDHTDPASAVPSDAPNCVAVFWRPPTSALVVGDGEDGDAPNWGEATHREPDQDRAPSVSALASDIHRGEEHHEA